MDSSKTLIEASNKDAGSTESSSLFNKAIKQYLKDNLKVQVFMNHDSSSVDVKILLEGEEIASGHGSKYSGLSGIF